MNKFNIFKWLKGRKKEIKKKKDEKKIIIIKNEPKKNNIKSSDTFVEYIPFQPFFSEKEKNKKQEQVKSNKNQEKKITKENNEEKNKINIENSKTENVEDDIFTIHPPFQPVPVEKKRKNKDEIEKVNNNDDAYNEKNENKQIKDTNIIKTTQTNNVLNEIGVENKILDTIEQMLKEDYYEITKIKYELDILSKQEQENLTLKETDKLIDKLNNIIKEFEILKREFYSKNYDKLTINKANIPYIDELINDYKYSIKDNNITDISLPKIEKIEEYIKIITDIVTIEKKTIELNDNMEEKKNKLENADKGIEEAENEYKSIEKINSYIETFSNQQDLIINDLKRKIESSESITKTVEYKSELYINYSRLLTATMLMAATTIIPPTKRGNLLKIGLISASIASLTGVIKSKSKEYRTTTKIDIIDYESSIRKSLDNVSDIDKIVNNSIKDINDLKKNFIKEFDEYKDVIPEYTSLLSKLDSLEKELISKSKIVQEYEDKLNETLSKNNVKVKRLEEEYFN